MTFERQLMLLELRQITRPNVLKTDTEAEEDRERTRAICHAFGEEYPEDVLEKFDPPPSELEWQYPILWRESMRRYREALYGRK